MRNMYNKIIMYPVIRNTVIKKFGDKIMANINKTETGTLIVKGVEFNKYPPPSKLIKVMKKCWADDLISKGIMRFGNLEEYRTWENEILGDTNDGNGMYTMVGHQYNTGSANEVFAWCTSLTEISDKRILEIAKSNGYDCIVEVKSPINLVHRISKALLSSHNGDLILHCGCVKYDRGKEVGKRTLNSQIFHFNVFQKDPKFREDHEYRFSITNYALGKNYGDYVCANIGNCSDIVQIKDLPV